MSSGTLLHLVISCCIGASVMTEIVSERSRAEIFVLNVASLSARPQGHLEPLEARLTTRNFCIRWLRGLSPLLLCSYVLFE